MCVLERERAEKTDNKSKINLFVPFNMSGCITRILTNEKLIKSSPKQILEQVTKRTQYAWEFARLSDRSLGSLLLLTQAKYS